jgi:hypothetical protein
VYKTIQPPFSLDFFQMSRRDLVEYFAWFQDILGVRTRELESVVRETSGFELWNATFERSSLGSLGNWFATSVTTRPRTSAELEHLNLQSVSDFGVSAFELTNESFSFAIDIGMYFARTLMRTHPQVTWKQFLNNKRFADYGQPVLVGFGSVPLNPVRIGVTLGYGLTTGREGSERLCEVFDYWSARATIENQTAQHPSRTS